MKNIFILSSLIFATYFQSIFPSENSIHYDTFTWKVWKLKANKNCCINTDFWEEINTPEAANKLAHIDTLKNNLEKAKEGIPALEISIITNKAENFKTFRIITTDPKTNEKIQVAYTLNQHIDHNESIWSMMHKNELAVNAIGLTNSTSNELSKICEKITILRYMERNFPIDIQGRIHCQSRSTIDLTSSKNESSCCSIQ